MSSKDLIDTLVSGEPRHEQVADAALRFGVVGALGAALTGPAQYVDTRETAAGRHS